MIRAKCGRATKPGQSQSHYQFLVGTWPVELLGDAASDPEALASYAERLKGALTKSMREAKAHSTWAAPDTAYEAAMPRFFRDWRDGRFKLAALATLLGLRRGQPTLFAEGAYEPVAAHGPQADQVCAFLRSHEDATALAATARFPSRLQVEGFGQDTALALPETLQATRWRDALTGREVRAEGGALAASTIFAALPAAVLLPAP